MEKDMVDYSLDLLFGNEFRLIKKLHHTDKTNFEKSGLICGGYQTIIFSVIDKSQTTLVENILLSIREKQNNELLITPKRIGYSAADSIKTVSFTNNSDEDWEYRENIGLPLIAYIAGGGHVGLAVSRVMKTLGFYIVVFDHREDVFTIEQNSFADEIIIARYEDIGKKIIESERSYIIIVTPMHAGDKATLKSVIDRKVKYIGMMGSRSKIKNIFDALLADGINEELFKKVHTPIGIDIEAETPEEIAISIAAEIIKVKNQLGNSADNDLL
ncbi:MAG: XdhC family protein [Ignavibacteriaceae bacterium]|nr:XdhC family protein [Ignavibacteriaceae bacterium]